MFSPGIDVQKRFFEELGSFKFDDTENKMGWSNLGISQSNNTQLELALKQICTSFSCSNYPIIVQWQKFR